MKVIVIGGGAGGCMAAGVAAENGHDVILLEANDKLGKKLYISGKGRCNITNDCTPTEFLTNVVRNGKFLLSAINNFTPQDTIEFCGKYGCEVKVERGNRVFPLSDKALDFIIALERFLTKSRVKIKFDCRVERLLIENNSIVGVQLFGGEKLYTDRVVVATGGKSYPGTGSTGDGYALAKSVGHPIVDLRAGLVCIDTIENLQELSGVSLKNVSASIIDNDGNVVASEFGEMLFTHTGVSGPIILSLSSKINRLDLNKLAVSIDLKPALDEKTLDSRVIADFKKYCNKELKNGLSDLLISALRAPIMLIAELDPDKKINQLSKEERLRLVRAIKNLPFKISKLGDLAGAIITSGGVSVAEVSPKDCQSKLIKGLYFAGEVLDVDALTGGFNIQIALATGYAVGSRLE